MTKKNLERLYDRLGNAMGRFEVTVASTGRPTGNVSAMQVEADREVVARLRGELMAALSVAHTRCGEIIPMGFRLCQKADRLLSDRCELATT